MNYSTTHLEIASASQGKAASASPVSTGVAVFLHSGGVESRHASYSTVRLAVVLDARAEITTNQGQGLLLVSLEACFSYLSERSDGLSGQVEFARAGVAPGPLCFFHGVVTRKTAANPMAGREERLGDNWDFSNLAGEKPAGATLGVAPLTSDKRGSPSGMIRGPMSCSGFTTGSLKPGPRNTYGQTGHFILEPVAQLVRGTACKSVALCLFSGLLQVRLLPGSLGCRLLTVHRPASQRVSDSRWFLVRGCRIR